MSALRGFVNPREMAIEVSVGERLSGLCPLADRMSAIRRYLPLIALKNSG
jgi:hypothetical protein